MNYCLIIKILSNGEVGGINIKILEPVVRALITGFLLSYLINTNAE
jgi:hypothetical protein